MATTIRSENQENRSQSQIQEMEALLRRAKAVIPDEHEDEIQVRTDITRYLNALQPRG